MKRGTDVVAALFGLLLSSPILATCALLIYLRDRKSPLYIADRVGKDAATFRMVKLRSMIVGADASKVDSTSAGDPRITSVGRFIRRSKLDELTQLYNVLRGEMSVVGPRPNVARETGLYTEQELRLLSVRPGITDLASIVFSDEGTILEGADDADLRYNQIIRPWKSRLGLVYVDNSSLRLDLEIVSLTVLGAFSRQRALVGVVGILRRLGADPELTKVSARREALYAAPPPGANDVVTSRRVDS